MRRPEKHEMTIWCLYVTEILNLARNHLPPDFLVSKLKTYLSLKPLLCRFTFTCKFTCKLNLVEVHTAAQVI